MSEHALSKQIAAAQVLKAALAELTDDPDTIADMIEGETNLHEAIASVMEGIGEDEMLCSGLSSMIQALAARKSRLEARVDRRRSAIERGMMAGEIQKLELPQATLSLRRVPPALQIVHEEEIPKTYFEMVPKLLRANLAADVKAGIQVPGTRLSNGSTTLSIRKS